jgi:hypothetical protein
MLKKILKILPLFILLFSFNFISGQNLPPQITATDITAYSVQLNLSNLSPNAPYRIILLSSSGNPSVNITTNNTGGGSMIFTDLSSSAQGVSYEARVTSPNDDRFLATTTFKTKASGVSVEGITAGSATIKAFGLDGYEPALDGKYVVSLRSAYSIRNDKTVTASGGSLEVLFDQLKPATKYDIYISRSNEIAFYILRTSFTTLGSTLSVQEITSSSAKIIATGLNPSFEYSFSVQTNTGLTEIKTTSDSIGKGEAKFTFPACSQSPCPTFTGYIKRININGTQQDIGLAPIQFSLRYSQIRISEITKNSVSVEVGGLDPLAKYNFALGGKGEKEVEADTGGVARVSFEELSEDFEYQLTVSKINDNMPSSSVASTKFRTLKADGTGGGEVSNNNNSPQFSGGLVPCGTEKDPITKKILNKCTYDHIFELINNVINFILYILAIPIAAIMFAYAGFLYLTSGGDTGKVSKATSIFGDVAMGLVFVAGAWLIIKTVLSILGYDGSWIGF